MVSGNLSPYSSSRKIANWPGFALLAISGASMLTLNIVFDVLIGYFSAILNIISISAFQNGSPIKGTKITITITLSRR